jgi:hypothetical protein
MTATLFLLTLTASVLLFLPRSVAILVLIFLFGATAIWTHRVKELTEQSLVEHTP